MKQPHATIAQQRPSPMINHACRESATVTWCFSRFYIDVVATPTGHNRCGLPNDRYDVYPGEIRAVQVCVHCVGDDIYHLISRIDFHLTALGLQANTCRLLPLALRCTCRSLSSAACVRNESNFNGVSGFGAASGGDAAITCVGNDESACRTNSHIRMLYRIALRCYC